MIKLFLREKVTFLLICFVIIFIFLCQDIFSKTITIVSNDKDSISFSNVEKEFSALIDTNNFINYHNYMKKFWEYYAINFNNFSNVDYNKFNNLYKDAREELNGTITKFRMLEIPRTFSQKVFERLVDSKEAFIFAYTKLFDAIEQVNYFISERSNIYLINYNNIMIEYDGSFNKGYLKFAQAKIKYESELK